MTLLATTRQVPQSFVIASAFMLLLLFYHLIFGDFFPNFQGKIGHDYSFMLPALLNGYFWFKTNSVWQVPWFSPAFCGGQPFFADVQSSYYSIPQLLTLFVDPLTSVYLSILLFACLGFWGMYLLVWQRFSLSVEASFLAATLFMFNGFYAHRMIVGHLGYQGFMLIPLVALLLLPESQAIVSKNKIAVNATLVGVTVAYWLQSGLTSLLIPVGLAVFAINCLVISKSGQWKIFCWRASGAILVALALSAAKLSAGLAFMRHFQRSDYLLPGVDGFFNTLKLLFTALFIAPADVAERAGIHLKHIQWVLDRHEWEYGISVIPLLIILAAWASTGWKKLHATTKTAQTPFKSPLALTLLAGILCIPLVINIYTPEWNTLLKHTPLLKSSSALFRWWLIYIPLIIIYAALSLEKLALPQKYRAYLVGAAVVGILLVNLTADRLFYHQQDYSPADITKAYQWVASGNAIPAISQINAIRDAKNNLHTPLNRNDLLILGMSQLACYNPSFGYRLENLPLKDLHIGSIFEQTQGHFNLKNPACYVFSTENQCQPGSHFEVTQQAQAQAFAHYQPYTFAISEAQKVANFITALALLLVTIFLSVTVIRSLIHKISKASEI